MTLIKSWSAAIEKISFKDTFDCQTLSVELLGDRVGNFDPDTEDSDCCITDNTPTVKRLRDTFIVPEVIRYIATHYGVSVSPSELQTRSWFRPVIDQGRLLPSHTHRLSHISTVCYFEGDDGTVDFTDPFTNQTLAYPTVCYQHHYGHFDYTPEAGDLLIFPSFLYHSVAPIKHPPRFCMPSDYLITK